MSLYFDYAAAAPLDPEVFKAMKPWLTENYANPSSIYQVGQKARAAVDKARRQIAGYLKCKPTEIYFTASGTESCNWALRGVVEKHLKNGKKPHIIVSSIEHSSVLEMARHLQELFEIEVTTLPVGIYGIVDLEDLKNAIKPETILVSVMTVNNEIGTIQPTREIGKICKERGVTFHTDACQTDGYIDLEVNLLGVDLLTMNAGKIYGPKGVGILYIREGVEIAPWTIGGGQEFKLRAGTENVAGIVGMGKAVEILGNLSPMNGIMSLRIGLKGMLSDKIGEIEVNGSLEDRIGNNLNILIPGADGEMLVKSLDLSGFSISTGSACASGSSEPSHVLLALGLSPEEARSSIRITLGRDTTQEQLEKFVEALSNSISLQKRQL